MKRSLILIIALALCISLCACGSPAPAAAPAVFEDTASEPETPPIREVTITTENFFDYFEFVEMPEYDIYIEKDSAGNLTAVSFQSGYYLKDGYNVAEENRPNCTVEVGVRFNTLEFAPGKGITVDPESRSYTVTGDPGWTYEKDEMETGYPYRLTEDDPWSYYIRLYGTFLSNDSSTFLMSDLDLVSASGTLYLYEEGITKGAIP